MNAAKHSGSDVVHVYSVFEDGRVAIFVRDDGAGFDVDAVEEGRGLEHSIRGRVESLGGEVCIESEPGEGTEVKVSLPIEQVGAP